MLTGLERVLARRIWFVPQFNVWGLPALDERDYLALDVIDSVASIYYGVAPVGQSEQQVLYSQLTDHRGNALPSSLQSPRVLVRDKGTAKAFVVGQESADRFKIARDPEVAGPIAVDLLVVELGD